MGNIADERPDEKYTVREYRGDTVSQAAAELQDLVLDGINACERALVGIKATKPAHFGGGEGRKAVIAIWEARISHLVALGKSLAEGTAPV